MKAAGIRGISGRDTIRLVLSRQSVDLLEQLGEFGIYGASPEEVAERFVDEALQRFVERPVLRARPTARRRAR